MTVIDDYANAMNSYPADETTIEFVDVAKANNPNDTAINVREVWEFRVKLTNNGHVNMRNVSIHLLGLEGTGVREVTVPPSNFETSIIVGSLNPDGGEESDTTQVFQFKAPTTPQPAGTKLIHTHVQEWSSDTNDHMATNHTKGHSEAADLGIAYPVAFLEGEVFP